MQQRKENKKIVKKPEFRFLLSAFNATQFPSNTHLDEFAFVGRSNVGKSSLINALLGADACKVSKTPGRTQCINFFEVKVINKIISITDLPGYGYAAVSKQTKLQWNETIFDYLQNRKNLRRVFLLIDARHGIKDNDAEIMSLLDHFGVLYQIVLTKLDKMKSSREKMIFSDIQDSIRNNISHHSAAFPEFIISSANRGYGLTDLFNVLKNT